jgi:hypothetical protein
MRRHYITRPDGKGGYHFVELHDDAPPPQYAPATISDSIPYGPPRLGEIIQSQTPERQYSRSDERIEIGNGEAMTRPQPWPQPEPAESAHRDLERNPAEPRAEADQSPRISDDIAEFESAPVDGGASELANATPSLPRVSAKVSLPNPQPTLSLGVGNYSSCPKCVIQTLRPDCR